MYLLLVFTLCWFGGWAALVSCWCFCVFVWSICVCFRTLGCVAFTTSQLLGSMFVWRCVVIMFDGFVRFAYLWLGSDDFVGLGDTFNLCALGGIGFWFACRFWYYVGGVLWCCLDFSRGVGVCVWSLLLVLDCAFFVGLDS